MEPPLPRNPFSAKRMVTFLVSGYVAGTLAGTFLGLRQPKVYEGSATIESPDHAGHAERITRLRAQMVARDLDLENRWVTTFDGAVAIVEEAVRLKPAALGVRVEVRYEDPREALAIAEQLAKGLDTPRREAEMASTGLQVKPYTSSQQAAVQDIVDLEWLLRQEAVNAGYTSAFQLVELASTGDPKAAAIMNSEDFSRRWTMFKDLSPKIGYLNPPGEPFRGPNTAAKAGEFPFEPVLPIPGLWINGGRFGGLILAGLVLLAIKWWKPSFLRPYPPKPPRPMRARPASPPAANNDPW